MTVDLTTDYLGLHLRSPLVASASPLTGAASVIQRKRPVGSGVTRGNARAPSISTSSARPSASSSKPSGSGGGRAGVGAVPAVGRRGGRGSS